MGSSTSDSERQKLQGSYLVKRALSILHISATSSASAERKLQGSYLSSAPPAFCMSAPPCQREEVSGKLLLKRAPSVQRVTLIVRRHEDHDRGLFSFQTFSRSLLTMTSSVATRKAQKVAQVLKQVAKEVPKLYEELCDVGQLYVVKREVEKVMDLQERNGLFPSFEEVLAYPAISCVGGGLTQTGKTSFPAVSRLWTCLQLQSVQL